MKFIKNIRDSEIEFSVDNITSEKFCYINVRLPPYGSYKRGELYTAVELASLIKEEVKDITMPPLSTLTGRHRALKKDFIFVRFEFKKTAISKNVVSKPSPSSRKQKIQTRKSKLKK